MSESDSGEGAALSPSTASSSQLDTLQASLAHLLARGSALDNPMVQGLQWQIASQERRIRREAGGGYFDTEGKLRWEYCNPIA